MQIAPIFDKGGPQSMSVLVYEHIVTRRNNGPNDTEYRETVFLEIGSILSILELIKPAAQALSKLIANIINSFPNRH